MFTVIDYKTKTLYTYTGLTSINILLMFMNVMQYFTFSSKLSMFYEIISAALFDIVFFTIMQLIIMFGYSLMGHMLFGTTDNDFSSITNSSMTLFLMIIGSKSVQQISTIHEVIRGFFGVTFMIINILLLNMLVAIYASHYFQFYAEQGQTKSQILYLLFRILGGNEIYDEKEHKAKTWIEKVRRMFQKLAELTKYGDKEEVEEFDDRENLIRNVQKQLLHDQNLVNSEALEEFKERTEAEHERKWLKNPRAVNEHYSKIYFWTSVLDKQCSKIILGKEDGYFSSLISDTNLIEDMESIDKEKKQHPIFSDQFSDDEIAFMMKPFHLKVIAWNKASVYEKMRYWVLMQSNSDLLQTLEEEKKEDAPELDQDSHQKFIHSRSSSRSSAIPIYDNSDPKKSPSDESEEASKEDSHFDDHYEARERQKLGVIQHASRVQVELWKSTTDINHIFELWMGENIQVQGKSRHKFKRSNSLTTQNTEFKSGYFTFEQKVALWEKLELPFEYFKEIAYSHNSSDSLRNKVHDIINNEDEYNYKQLLSSLSTTELNLL